jgi:hypothetical protein
MVALLRRGRRARVGLVTFAAVAAALVAATPVLANLTLTRIGSDPFTNGTSQHATQLEPDTFSFGNTIVSAFQSGRFTDGGSSDIGFATSTNGGTSWTSGFLTGITTFVGSGGQGGGGTFARVSDPSVAFDALHNVWLIASLPLSASVTGAGVIVSRSTTGGLSWGSPVTVNADPGTDKTWIACDDTSSSPFYGHCYTEWDLNAAGNLIQMSTSTDGGLTWGPKETTTHGQAGLGGQPVVQPNGTVIVPIDNANETAVGAFRSTNGGVTWSDVTTIALIRSHIEAGNLRSGPLPTAEIDGAGKVFVAWSDSRFRRGRINDIVYSTSSDGLAWSAVTRVPIDATNSSVDHFIPGLAVDRSTSGAGAHLVLTYYFYPVSSCSQSTCQLDVGTISSTNGGASWGTATMVAGPMTLTWLASTTQGFMVGDYISTSFSGGLAHAAFAVANAPSGSVFDEGTYTTTSGVALAGGSVVGEVAGADRVPAGINGANQRDSHTRH